MKYYASPSFWELHKRMPSTVQDLANKNFELLKSDPKHPSLHLKKVGKYWSARVGRNYHALAVEVDKGLLWFWIGTHAEYDKVVS